MADELRQLTGDLYGLKGRHQGVQVVDHLVRGLVVRIGRDDQGRRCLFARGREFPLDDDLLYDVQQRSKRLPAGTATPTAAGAPAGAEQSGAAGAVAAGVALEVGAIVAVSLLS